jgi:hypothetical protein
VWHELLDDIVVRAESFYRDNWVSLGRHAQPGYNFAMDPTANRIAAKKSAALVLFLRTRVMTRRSN